MRRGTLLIRNGKHEPVATEAFSLCQTEGELVLYFSVTEERGRSLKGRVSWALPGARLKKAVVVHSAYGIPGRVSLANRFGEILVFGAGNGIFRSCRSVSSWFTLLPTPPILPILALGLQADAIGGSEGFGYSLYLERLCRVRALGSPAGALELQWYGGHSCVLAGRQAQLRHGGKVVYLAEFLRDE